jgi:phosphoribosylformylglycinamidine synthase subunit PurQ / glutaminase
MDGTAKALVITGFGLNCENETAIALRACGAQADELHLNLLIRRPERLRDYRLLAFVGGFSFGDHLGAGTVFANRVRHTLGPELQRFIDDGKLVIGICNGFQTLTRIGLVPALEGNYFQPQAALAPNDQGVFRDAWVTLQCNPASPCVFTRGIDLIPLPIRHGEGKFVVDNEETLAQLEERHLVAMRYVCPDTGRVATDFPDNPNGSWNAIAGICDPSGRVFGLMPHPEAYLSPYNHPHWTRQKINGVLPEQGLGRQIFQNAVDYLRDRRG